MRTCAYCLTEKDEEHFPPKGRMCKACRHKRNYELQKLREGITQTEWMRLLGAVDIAMRLKRKADLECACKEIVKFCDKYKIYRKDGSYEG